jgi:hypothetical protein
MIYYSPISMDFLPLILYPCYRSLGYSLSYQRLYIRWPTQGITTPTTTVRTTRMSIHCHPLHLLLSKCWLCKHKCLRLCSRPWSICRLLNLKRCHHRRGIGLEIFSALSNLPFLMPWSQWMLTIVLSQFKRCWKW